MYSFFKHQQKLCYRNTGQTIGKAAVSRLCRRIISILVCIVLVLPTPAAVAHEEYPEEKIKAAYLYNFLRFVSWPDEPLDEYRICTYGLPVEHEAVFGSIAEIKTDRQLAVSFVKTDDSLQRLDNCQLVYIASSNKQQVANVIERMQDKGSLTVGEAQDFLEQGGMIRFVPVADKIRFEINIDAANKAGLKISSNVLKIAVRLVAVR